VLDLTADRRVPPRQRFSRTGIASRGELAQLGLTAPSGDQATPAAR
jgi:hypothetical protein